ncbi:hypothetical protein V5799_004248 [Amblyomma americanum]|uniref:Uncharacterized protein n=1 Tax=Amblyomma americanum TaxID=6943 RepID=A0AAQ4D6M9_AMBAM
MDAVEGTDIDPSELKIPGQWFKAKGNGKIVPAETDNGGHVDKGQDERRRTAERGEGRRLAVKSVEWQFTRIPSGFEKIVMRPQGCLEQLLKHGGAFLADVISKAAGTNDRGMNGIITFNTKQQSILIATEDEAKRDKYAAVKELTIGNEKVAIKAYVAAPENSGKGVNLRRPILLDGRRNHGETRILQNVEPLNPRVDIDVVELRGALEQYGPVENIALEYVPGFDGVPSGTRRVQMEMKSALPNFLQVAEFTVQCEYEGVARVCRRCGSRDHVRAACDVPLCACCGVFGHATCELPCPQCGGDHAVAKCETRTFASIAKRAMVAAAAAAASQVPVAPEKTPGPVPATQDAVFSGPAVAENSQDEIEQPTSPPEPAQHVDDEPARQPPRRARRKRRRGGGGTSPAG